MRLGTAIDKLIDNYRYASDKEWIKDKVAWALYHTWKEADERKAEQTETQIETQNSNLTFEKRTMLDCYNCKRYESEEECVECRYEPKQTEPNHYQSFADLLFDKDKQEQFIKKCKAMGIIEDEPKEQTDCPWK